MDGNFLFLAEKYPALEKMGTLAEGYLYADPNACLYKMGSMAETMVNYIFIIDKLKPPSGSNNTQANKVKLLYNKGLFSDEINNIFYALRVNRNVAVHEGYDSFEKCVSLIEMAHTLAVWFMQVYVDMEFDPEPFSMPEDIRGNENYKKVLLENEKLAASLEKAEAAILAHEEKRQIHLDERKRRAENAANRIKLSEREVRFIIEEHLRSAGWETDVMNLRYSRGTRPEKGRNIAIAEWPTDLAVCNWGYADYALFVGLKLVGVVEVNADRRDVKSAIGNQCREYSMGIKEEHLTYAAGDWDGLKAPFLFAVNGRAFIRQTEDGGLWFKDARETANEAETIKGWLSPRKLSIMLKKSNTDKKPAGRTDAPE